MPAFSATGQPVPPFGRQRLLPMDWFVSQAGQVLLASEERALRQVLGAHPGMPWLWLSPCVQPSIQPEGRGVCLIRGESGRWVGDALCTLPLPLPSEVFANIVVQHAITHDEADTVLAELARLLVPGGRLWLFALNPVSPWCRHWRGSGLDALGAFRWRQHLRRAGLVPDTVARGLGPSWRQVVEPSQQARVGLRAAYVLCAEKRQWPLTPQRHPQRVRLNQGVPA